MSVFNLKDWYFEAYVVWEGALDEERIFPIGNPDRMVRWATQIVSQARREKKEVEVCTRCGRRTRKGLTKWSHPSGLMDHELCLVCAPQQEWSDSTRKGGK
jgi:hypothetical protein